MYTKDHNPVLVKRQTSAFSKEDSIDLDLSHLEETQTTENSIVYPLHVFDGSDDSLLQIVKLRPIIKFYNSNLTDALNCFVQEIELSSVSGSKIYFDESYNCTEDFIENTVIAIVTTNNNSILVINDNQLLRILKEQPHLVVSPEGYLVFYTDAEMYITLDGLTGTLITHGQIKEAASYISDHDMINQITVYDNVIIVDLFRKIKERYVMCSYELSINANQNVLSQPITFDLTLKKTRSL